MVIIFTIKIDKSDKKATYLEANSTKGNLWRN